MERIAKPDVSRNLCLSIMGFSSQSTPRYHMNVIYLSFICQGELALQAALCAAWLADFYVPSISSQVGPAQMGPICCTRGWVFLLVSVRETTIFRSAEEGVA